MDVKFVIEEFLKPSCMVSSLTGYFSCTTLKLMDLDIKIHIYPSSICIPDTNYVPVSADSLLSGFMPVGVKQYFIFRNKDEHFNASVQDKLVLPFECNVYLDDFYKKVASYGYRIESRGAI